VPGSLIVRIWDAGERLQNIIPGETDTLGYKYLYDRRNGFFAFLVQVCQINISFCEHRHLPSILKILKNDAIMVEF
jgi:hypothetical protein